MKKLLVLGILILIAYDLVGGKAFQTKDKMMHVNVHIDKMNQGKLVLINEQYPVVTSAIPADLVAIHEAKLQQTIATKDNQSIQISAEVLAQLDQMLQAADKDDVTHFIVNSGYRSVEDQAKLYADLGADYALPAGYSEHNLGLAIDIGSTQGTMENTAEGEWMQEHGWQYGFVLRYPADKTAITGIQYEPWHFRYVGLPHSAIMQREGWVLEEYIEHLRKQKSYETKVKGQKYAITYFEEINQVQVIKGTSYEISGDNVAGVIVTTAF